MRHEDQRAKNLLIRLFTYSPRPGERETLEDYCTEALAWCLRESSELLGHFLDLTKIPALKDRATVAAIHTQLRYRGQATDDDEPEITPSEGCFDLVIEGGLPEPFVVVVECKVWSDFSPDQLKKYRDQLDRSTAFSSPEADKFLVTLTTHQRSAPESDASVTWPQVYEVLTRSFLAGDAPPHPCVQQFAELLKEHGLAPLTLMKTDPSLLTNWFSVKRLTQDFERIVRQLRDEETIKEFVAGKRMDDKRKDWIGLKGKNEFWAGFGEAEFSEGPQLCLWVEITLPGDRRDVLDALTPEMRTAFNVAKRYLSFHKDEGTLNFDRIEDRKSRLVFTQDLVAPFDGNAEECLGWLSRASHEVIRLADAPQGRAVRLKRG